MDSQFEKNIFNLLLRNTTRQSEISTWYQCDLCWETHSANSPLCAFHDKCYYLLYTADANDEMLQELVECTTWCLQSSRDDQFKGPQAFVCEFDKRSPYVHIPIDFQATMAVKLYNIDRLQDALSICWSGFKVSESGTRPSICSGAVFSCDIGPIKHTNGQPVCINLLMDETDSEDEDESPEIITVEDSSDSDTDSSYQP